jgi:hypothetical protein
MQELSQQERRQYKRIKKNFVTRFQLKGERPRKQKTENWEMVITQNLSAGGVLFNYDKEIQAGSKIDLLVNFPQAKHPINCTGQVIRIDRNTNISLLKVAASFVDIDEEDKHAISRAAEEFYSRQANRIEL